MDLVVAVIVGLGAGIVARAAFPDRSHLGGVYMSALLGIAGSVLAWLFGVAVGGNGIDDGTSVGASMIGAIVVLATHRLVARASG